MNILSSIRCTSRAAFSLASIPRNTHICRVDPLILSRQLAVMGSGGSKAEGGRKKRSKRETAAVATPAAEGEGGKESIEAQFVECRVAKTSEFGENE